MRVFTGKSYQSIEMNAEPMPFGSVQHKGTGHAQKKGLTVITAALFLVGEMAGSGVLALPRAVVDTGWNGVVMLILCCAVAGHNGIMLGRCWNILQLRWPEYRDHVRDPYPAIGERAFGKVGKVAVSVCVNITLFGVATVFLLLAAENLQTLVQDLSPHNSTFSFCFWLIILAGALTPFTWLGSPKDFWPAAVAATVATVLACVLMFIGVLVDIPNFKHAKDQQEDIKAVFLTFGTILFAFGGASTFPTIQHDMKEPEKFYRSVVLAFAALLLMYLPVSIAGFLVYKSECDNNILSTLTAGGLKYASLILITLHLIFAFIIVINPVCQELEERLRIANKFGIFRILLRTCLVGLVLFTGESLPHFGAILSLVGGSTITCLTFVFPSMFYLKLSRQTSPDWPEIEVQPYEWAWHIEFILIGVVGGIASTYSAIDGIAGGFQVVPCYVNMTAADM
ncbi:amino acid transporter AVT1J-like isoform X1 [Branchiostoma floridae]|uniref:Amino acid transporter AVT1J-like isoform X1 n=2 Tax=Branchiostoma floridae TaxID=7739 RepID=A0A9J7HMV8_BRAFL|nr:amino acid transporter AVT1J-like isoform X1 [Branchiostoma floridae]